MDIYCIVITIFQECAHLPDMHHQITFFDCDIKHTQILTPSFEDSKFLEIGVKQVGNVMKKAQGI